MELHLVVLVNPDKSVIPDSTTYVPPNLEIDMRVRHRRHDTTTNEVTVFIESLFFPCTSIEITLVLMAYVH